MFSDHVICVLSVLPVVEGITGRVTFDERIDRRLKNQQEDLSASLQESRLSQQAETAETSKQFAGLCQGCERLKRDDKIGSSEEEDDTIQPLLHVKDQVLLAPTMSALLPVLSCKGFMSYVNVAKQELSSTYTNAYAY